MQESGIFKTAVKLPPQERAAYLDKACGSNASLRLEIEGLLRAHEQPGDFMHRPPIADMTTTLGPGPERPGMRVGPYKLLQFLGEGGMGTVFLAEQTEPVRRMVALKIVKPGMDSSQVLARFEAERQALALMDHPNIAKVLDAGTTSTNPKEQEPNDKQIAKPKSESPNDGGCSDLPAGSPYFVMELVKGVPITQFCDQNKFTTRQRLELFIPVCNAIQHAHMKGIIHRDIKPSNVLVALYDGKPVPKVIDFGVAKAMAEPLTQRTLFTQIGQIVGTFEYMSPEQATLNQLDIDTRSDIYSLGVLLYELLTGVTPLDKDRLRGLALDQMLRTIREEEPMPPSSRLSSAAGALAMAAAYRGGDSHKLVGTLRGELDWIVMKCLEKERDRRFVTAGSLAQDIERYLRDEPVTACPPSLGYRLRKAYRKNRAMLTTAAICMFLLLAGIVATSWQAFRATEAEGVAVAKQKEAEKAQQAEAAQRKIADDAKEKAQRERDALRIAQDQLRRAHYAVAMNAVQSAWEADEIVRALELLEEQKPKAGEDDLRGFEWYYWDRMCHAERGQRKIAGGRPVSGLDAILSGDGSRAVYYNTVFSQQDTESGFGLGPLSQRISNIELTVLDLPAQKKARTWTFPNENNFNARALLNHDGSRVAFVHGKREVPSSQKKPKENKGFPFASFGGGFTLDRVEVFDVASGKERIALRGSFEYACALSADGKRLATVESLTKNEDDFPSQKGPFVLKVHDVDQPAAAPVVIPMDFRLQSDTLEFNHDGTRLAAVQAASAATAGPFETVAKAYKLRLWDAASGKNLATLDLDMLPSALAFSSDGTRLAGIGAKLADGRTLSSLLQPRRGSSNLETYVWQVSNDDNLKLLRATPLGLSAAGAARSAARLVASPDGRRLAFTGTYGSVATLVDTDTGEVRQHIKTTPPIASVAFSTDARLITLGSLANEFIAKEWDVDRKEPPAPVSPKKLFESFRELTVASSDGRRRLVYQMLSPFNPGSDSSTAISIRNAKGKEIRRFNGHEAAIAQVRFSPDGRLVYSADRDGVLKIWEADTGIVRKSFQVSLAGKGGPFGGKGGFGSPGGLFGGKSGIGSPGSRGAFVAAFGAISGDGHFILFPDESEKQIKVYRFNDLSEVVTLGAVTGVQFSLDGRRLIATNQVRGSGFKLASGDLQLWDLEAARNIPLDAVQTQNAYLSPDGRWLIAISANDPKAKALQLEMRIFDVVTGGRIATEPCNGNQVVFAPDNRTFLTLGFGPGKETAIAWDAATGKKRSKLDLGQGNLGRIVGGGLTRGSIFSADGNRVVLPTTTPARPTFGLPTVFDLNTGASLFRLEGVSGSSFLVTFSPDGKRIATLDNYSNNHTIRLWDGLTGRELVHFKTEGYGFFGPIGNLSFSADGHRLTYSANIALAPNTTTWDGTPRVEAKQP